jgi:fumarate hydratase subunit alpha
MRKIDYYKIVEIVEKTCIDICCRLSDDVLSAIKDAIKKESNPRAEDILKQLIENADIAKKEGIPLCQDTGLLVVFAEQGVECSVVKNNKPCPLEQAVNEGVKRGYQKGYLRKSVVSDPLKDRKNTNTNAPSLFYLSQSNGDKIKLSIMAKGGGCENKSQFKMFNPTAEKEEIIEWIVQIVKQAGANACPPFVIGVGIGGNFEKSCLLSKKSLLRDMQQYNDDVYYADLERELLKKINCLGIGAQGLGGDTTALGVKIETAPCHIASLPVAVNIECHSHRHKSIEI